MNKWLKKVADFGRAAKNSERPLSFVLGAGCSISSGAPPTAAVQSAFEEATAGRSDGQQVREFLQHIKESERQRILDPLFEEIAPHIGYRCLAALAKIRRVHVLNLNWDPLVEIACRNASVECVSFDLRDHKRWKEMNNLPLERGVASVHVHGLLGTSCRYSVLETATFDPEETRFIRDMFWDNFVLIAGASLQGDLDLEAFLYDGRTNARSSPLWYFGRGQLTDEAAHRSVLDRLHLLGADPREFCIDPAVDFDRLMLTLLEEIKEVRWSDVVATSHSALLPPEEELIIVRPELLRNALDSGIIGLVGEARLGKTVLAHFLAHCFRLWEKDPIEVRRFDTPDTTVAALGAVNEASTSAIYILEDPFGSTDRFEDNPGFFAEVTRLFASGAIPNSRLIVTSRRRGWHIASEKQQVATRLFTIVSERASDWYRHDDLNQLTAGDKRLNALVAQGVIRTPGLVAAEKRRHRLTGSTSPCLIDGDTVNETAMLLEQFPEAGILCSLVRLQDFCQIVFPEDEILQVAETTNRGVTEGFLHRFQFEGQWRFRLDHPTTQQAVDLYLANNIHSITDYLNERLYPGHQLVRALNAWKLLSNRSADPPPASASERERWAPAYFAANPTLTRLHQALDSVGDQWGMTELAYELVRLWEALPSGKERLHLLSRFTGDRLRFGTYALFEGCLYLQAAASAEIRQIVDAEAWKLVSDPDMSREAALLVDGWMWRPLPEGGVPEWVVRFLGNLGDDNPAWALVRFLEGYHPEGFALLPHDFSERDKSISWTSDQAEFAVWLVKWHFSHQANARVLMSRLRLMDKRFLCRSLHPERETIPARPMARLIESIADFSQLAGWAFHLGCNVRCVQGRLSSDLVDQLRRLINGVSAADEGLITAAVTYESSELFRPELRRYFAAEENRTALLDIVRDGIRIDGSSIKPPRFAFSRQPAALYADLDIRWKQLGAQKLIPQNPSILAREFWTVAGAAIAAGRISGSEVDRFCAEIELGDLRRLEQYATPARAGSSPLQQILDTYIVAKSTMPLFTQ